MSEFHLLPGLAMLSMFGHGPSVWWSGRPEFALGFVRVFSIVFLAGGVLGIVAGWGPPTVVAPDALVLGFV